MRADSTHQQSLHTAPLSALFAIGARVAAAAAYVLQVLIGELDVVRGQLPPGVPLGTALAAFANWAAEGDHFEILRRLAEVAIALDQKPGTMTGISYAMVDIHNYRDFGCTTWGDSVEVFFDASSPELVKYVDKLFQRMAELNNGFLTGKPLAFAGYICMRYMHRSAGLIATQKWLDTCSLEIAGIGEVDGTTLLGRHRNGRGGDGWDGPLGTTQQPHYGDGGENVRPAGPWRRAVSLA